MQIHIITYPECGKYVALGYHNAQFNFRMDLTRLGEIFSGQTPSRNEGELMVIPPPEGYHLTYLPELSRDHSPSLYDINV
jgi:Mn-containing catalase